MMHDTLLAMLRSNAVVSVTAAPGLWEHLVDEVVFALQPSGRWTALCGAVVVSADLGALPTGRCRLCVEVARSRHR
jgi:hypothetical protein